MGDPLYKLDIVKKNGAERFRARGSDLNFNVLDYWRWSASDLVGNTARGILAEYIVARALKIPMDKEIRDEWARYDLETPDGVKIEVKSAAYVQSWKQTRYSQIKFGVSKTRTWDAESGYYDLSEPMRHADVYVFALFAQREMPIDPLDLDQWQFYALATQKLDDRKSISLSALSALEKEKLAWPATYHDLADAVREAVGWG